MRRKILTLSLAAWGSILILLSAWIARVAHPSPNYSLTQLVLGWTWFCIPLLLAAMTAAVIASQLGRRMDAISRSTYWVYMASIAACAAVSIANLLLILAICYAD